MIPKLISDSDFQNEVIDATQDVLVDFYADWCQPCKVVDKILHDIGARVNGALKIVKIDVMKSQNTASSYMISSLPTVMMFKKGMAVDQKVGLRSRLEYEKMIES